MIVMRNTGTSARTAAKVPTHERIVAVVARAIRRMPVLNPYEKRRQNTDRKLRDALDRFVKGTPHDASAQGRSCQLCVASLAREDGVARSAIYTDHRAR